MQFYLVVWVIQADFNDSTAPADLGRLDRFGRRSENLQKRYRDKPRGPPFRGLIWDDGF